MIKARCKLAQPPKITPPAILQSIQKELVTYFLGNSALLSNNQGFDPAAAHSTGSIAAARNNRINTIRPAWMQEDCNLLHSFAASNGLCQVMVMGPMCPAKTCNLGFSQVMQH